MKPLFTLALLAMLGSATLASPLQPYNLVWDSQSQNSAGSMPCGGGDVGLNVWAENDELLFYIARSGTFDENNAMLKLGRVRLQLLPNPFADGDFRQELMLHEGCVKVSGANKNLSVELRIWVDVLRPVVHVDMTSSKPVALVAGYETWRHIDRRLTGKANNANSYKWAPQGEVKTYRDSVDFALGGVQFVHRNRADLPSIFDQTVSQQGLDTLRHRLFNPLANLTFGGLMQGDNMQPKGVYDGIYAHTDFRGYALQSTSPRRSHHLTIALHTAQAADYSDWQRGLQQLLGEAKKHERTAQQRTEEWWKNFWQRSYVVIAPDSIGTPQWQAGRAYQLFRYQLACNAYGQYPTKFNGGLFTFDPCHVDSLQPFTPDHRAWGGGTFTAQNQRLVYFPMLRSGDFDMMPSQLDFYLRLQGNAELRSQAYWGHGGACFTEQMENFGLPNAAEYGWKRPPFFDRGVEYNAWLEYQWDAALEFCFMALELHRYGKAGISRYLPLVESCLSFFDEHYRYLAARRSRKPLDDNGHLVLYPGSACETYKMATNATPTIAALQTALQRMIALPDLLVSPSQKQRWSAMLRTIPPIALRECDGHTTIAPAKLWERINNTEAPQLYPVFPWGIYGVGLPQLDLAISTYRHDPDLLRFRSHVGWKQDNIFAARLGLTDDAAALCLQKFAAAPHRFPTFWGPGFDWTPDHNHGGSAMIGLQEMLLQTPGDSIYLLPAWPRSWDVHFKLHAPHNTTVEVILRGGKIELLRVTPQERKKDLKI